MMLMRARSCRACPPAHLISDVWHARRWPISDNASRLASLHPYRQSGSNGCLTPRSSRERRPLISARALPGFGGQWPGVLAGVPKHDRLL